MGKSSRWTSALALVSALCAGSVESRAACEIEAVGVPPAEATDYIGLFMGGAAGQTFMALDTLVASITTWRLAAEDTVDWPTRIWISDVDSAGVPRVRGEGFLYRGETKVFYGDGKNPVPLRYTFEPPLILPGKGRYALFVQNTCGFYHDLLVSTSADLYADGHLWGTSRSNIAGCPLSYAYDYPEWRGFDLCFEIEFCRDITTRAKRKTWGQVKAVYR